MLITFTTEHGNLVIRGEDLRRLEDGPEQQCIIGWVEHETVHHSPVNGTAAENLARIVQQEAQVVAAYEEAQRQQRHTRDGRVKR